MRGDFVDVGHAPTPQQFDDINRRPTERSGEQRLMFALLDDAISCIFSRGTGGTKQRPALQQEALMWVSGRWESSLSFDDVCGALGINADALRARLFHQLQQQRRGSQLPRLPRRQAVRAIDRTMWQSSARSAVTASTYP